MSDEPITITIPARVANRQITQALAAMIQLRDYYYELMEHAEEITARVNRDTEMPDELKRYLGEQS